MTKEQLMKFIEVDSQEGKEDCPFYLDIKGVEIHRSIMEYLQFDFAEGSKIKWSVIAQKLQEDKRIRDRLYIYLATLEEYIRAYISNKYQDNIRQNFWIDGKASWNKIKTNLQSRTNLFEVLQDADFGTLINQVKNLPQEDRASIFDEKVGTDDNLNAVIELRNAVSHHKFLLKHNFKECKVGDEISNTLENNIKNLRQLLPLRYRYGKDGNGGITEDMIKCGIFI